MKILNIFSVWKFWKNIQWNFWLSNYQLLKTFSIRNNWRDFHKNVLVCRECWKCLSTQISVIFCGVFFILKPVLIENVWEIRNSWTNLNFDGNILEKLEHVWRDYKMFGKIFNSEIFCEILYDIIFEKFSKSKFWKIFWRDFKYKWFQKCSMKILLIYIKAF